MAPSALTISDNYLPLYNLDGTAGSKTYHYGDEYQTQASESPKDLIGEAFQDRVSKVDPNTCEPGEEDAFFVADLGEVYRQHLRWKLHLPRVKPFYAVKCNPDPQVLKLLCALGLGFDCASKSEIEQVLGLGIDPSRIIYAQPCKTKSYVRYAAREGVKQMTFDNADELYKIKELYPDAELFLRILTDDSTSLCRLSLKFGASLDSTFELLNLAKVLDLNVVGVSFHVGSGASDPQSFLKAVQDSRIVFDQALELGYDLKTLDVGGGFTNDTFETMAAVLSDALDECFPPYVHVIAEPGRFYVSSAFTLACNVISRRDVYDHATGATSYMLYLNDGVYGNFSSIMFDHQHPIPRLLSAAGSFLYSRVSPLSTHNCTTYSIWGPTCDGIDQISERVTFKELLDVGDWLYFEDMGAYTRCSATKFNGFTDNHNVLYVCSETGAKAVLGW
ncbi:MAG: Ornithine decarboxylase [Cirrosporium novae-zelandiae]|nr:MAG: Ornithine decarboxylase [Cirrosporium novae-zelandiae]